MNDVILIVHSDRVSGFSPSEVVYIVFWFADEQGSSYHAYHVDQAASGSMKQVISDRSYDNLITRLAALDSDESVGLLVKYAGVVPNETLPFDPGDYDDQSYYYAR